LNEIGFLSPHNTITGVAFAFAGVRISTAS
jgi:hypothetical protein